MASIENADHVRPLADFPENIWAHRIASFTLDKELYEIYAKEIEMFKTDVKRMLLATEKDMTEKFDLIDKVERLGISYHFEAEIEDQLTELFKWCANSEEYPNYDLYSAALQFRLLRQHGYNISCGVFNQFVDANGKFKECLSCDTRGMLGAGHQHSQAQMEPAIVITQSTNVYTETTNVPRSRGMLNLYEAAHVRTHGDSILEEALAFTRTHLTRGAPHEDSTLAKQVNHALELPVHKGIPRYEACRYISIYEEDESHNKLLLKFAKIDYNFLQMLHKQELCEMLRWGEELDIVSKIPYARERYVECYFWALGTFYEPQYSFARILLAKSVLWVGVIDDTYDAYGTLDELRILTDAVEKWDGSGIDLLPDYIKTAFMALLNFTEELNEDLAKQGRTYAFNHYKEEWKRYMKASFKQSQWFLTRDLPSFVDYLSIGLITSTYYLLSAAAFLGMNGATETVINWMSSNPKLLLALTKHGRLINDVASHKDFNVSEQEALKKFEEIAEDAWKEMNEECLRSTTVPREIPIKLLNLARIVEVVYKHREDGYTFPQKLEPYINAVLVDTMYV